jgi:hypothetical protein
MAKAKKTPSDKAQTTRSTAARKPSASKAAKAEKQAGAQQPTMIDTSSAAQAAAAMIANRNKLQKPAAEAESGLVDQLKQEIRRPTAHALGGLAGGMNQQKRSNLPTQGNRQLGPIQKGGGFNRTGVPRRTSG